MFRRLRQQFGIGAIADYMKGRSHSRTRRDRRQRSALIFQDQWTLELRVMLSAIQNVAGFTAHSLGRNDDGSSSPITLPFTANFFGVQEHTVTVNNNGNITFDGALSTYTPFALNTTAHQIIAPFFADVDTDGSASGVVTYGTGTINGHTAFGVDYTNVGYYSSETNKLDNFQVILLDRSDVAAGDFDIELNYGQIQWETGDASGGNNGLGGSSARVGFSNGTTTSGTFYELPGSGVPGSFLDSERDHRADPRRPGKHGPWPVHFPGALGRGRAACHARLAHSAHNHLWHGLDNPVRPRFGRVDQSHRPGQWSRSTA